jgi:hypothetical protein
LSGFESSDTIGTTTAPANENDMNRAVLSDNAIARCPDSVTAALGWFSFAWHA